MRVVNGVESLPPSHTNNNSYGIVACVAAAERDDRQQFLNRFLEAYTVEREERLLANRRAEAGGCVAARCGGG